jgi:hypothetical protein
MPDGTNELGALLSEFNVKISDLESKHELLRERVITLGDSFIKNRERLKKEINFVKDELREIKNSLHELDEKVSQIINETENFARKEELRLLERYMKLWEPLKFVKAEEVKEMIDDAIKNLKIDITEEEREKEKE